MRLGYKTTLSWTYGNVKIKNEFDSPRTQKEIEALDTLFADVRAALKRFDDAARAATTREG